MKTIKALLKDLNACADAKKWAKGKSWQEIYTTCPRGDWLLWLFKHTNPDDRQRLALAKGHCANTVRHLMTDPRSIAAVDAAIAFGEGRISGDELRDAAAAAAEAAAAARAAWAAAWEAAAAAWAEAAAAWEAAAAAWMAAAAEV